MGRLLLDEIEQTHCEQKITIFLPIDAKDYLSSLDMLRANQSLFTTDNDDITCYYYCSVADEVNFLEKYLYDECEKYKRNIHGKNVTQDLIIGPFGWGIMTALSYFILEKNKKDYKDYNVNIEIYHAQEFQYTSLYSLGMSRINTYLMDTKWIYDDENKNL
jgi:hypothetical protein